MSKSISKSKFKSQMKLAFKTYLPEEYKQKKEDSKSLFEKCMTKNRFGLIVEQDDMTSEGPPDDTMADFPDDMGFEDDMGGEEEVKAPTTTITDKPYEDLAWIAWSALQTEPSSLEGNEFYEQIKKQLGNARAASDIAANPAERERIAMSVFTLLEKIFEQNRI